MSSPTTHALGSESRVWCRSAPLPLGPIKLMIWPGCTSPLHPSSNVLSVDPSCAAGARATAGPKNVVEGPTWVVSSFLTRLDQLSVTASLRMLTAAAGVAAAGLSIGTLETPSLVSFSSSDETWKHTRCADPGGGVDIGEGRRGEERVRLQRQGTPTARGVLRGRSRIVLRRRIGRCPVRRAPPLPPPLPTAQRAGRWHDTRAAADRLSTNSRRANDGPQRASRQACAHRGRTSMQGESAAARGPPNEGGKRRAQRERGAGSSGCHRNAPRQSRQMFLGSENSTRQQANRHDAESKTHILLDTGWRSKC